MRVEVHAVRGARGADGLGVEDVTRDRCDLQIEGPQAAVRAVSDSGPNDQAARPDVGPDPDTAVEPPSPR